VPRTGSFARERGPARAASRSFLFPHRPSNKSRTPTRDRTNFLSDWRNRLGSTVIEFDHSDEDILVKAFCAAKPPRDEEAESRNRILWEPKNFMRKAFGLGLILAVASLCPAAAAGTATKLPVEITFALTDHGREVGCGAPLSGLGTGSADATLQEARFYVYDVKLIDSKGQRVAVALAPGDWQYADVALLDFKDARGGRAACSANAPAKNTIVSGTIPKGTYTGLEFSVGVPIEATVEGKSVVLNHSNAETAPAPLDIAGMSWSWQAGRKFIMIEVEPKGGLKRADGARARSWMVHLGSTGCKGNPATGEIASCSRPNRFTVTFDRFDRQKQTVALDLGTLFQGSDLAFDKAGANGCMSAIDDPECPAIFSALGLNLDETKPGAGDAGGQARVGVSPIFRLEAKP
jgi:uncharacterized repeat protein (TIGR04052 family)